MNYRDSASCALLSAAYHAILRKAAKAVHSKKLNPAAISIDSVARFFSSFIKEFIRN
jgi:hypothetical protein